MLTTETLVRTHGAMAHSPWSQAGRRSLRDGVIQVTRYSDANGDKAVLVEFTPKGTYQPSDRFTADLISSVKDSGGILNRAVDIDLQIDEYGPPTTVCLVAPNGKIKQILAALRAAAPVQ